MARYNSVNSTNSVGAGSTISSPFSGLLTTIPSAGTVAIPNPVLYTGTTQVFYNAAPSGNVILTTPSGVFNGPGASGTSSFTLPFGSIVTLISDGTNYITQDWIGGPVTATSLTASGAVTLSPANTTVTISPSGSGSLTINPATASNMDNVNVGATTQGTGKFSSLIATGNLSTTANTAATLGTGGTGALQSSGGASIAGILNVGGKTYLGDSVGIGNTSPTYKLDVGVNGSQSTTAGSGGNIRNSTAADTSPYTQARITVYGDTGVDTTNWGYLAYGADGVFRVVYAKTGSSIGHLSFGTSSATNGTGTYTEFVRINNSGNVGIGTTSPGATLDMGSRTDAIILPVGTTAQRPTGVNGMMRKNSSTGYVEYWDPASSSWIGMGAFSASGGTLYSSVGGFNYHVFTSSGQFIVASGAKSINILTIAGGGAGGGAGGNDGAGGGGAGGLVYSSAFLATSGIYTVTVGGGASGAGGGTNGGNGNSSQFGSLTTAVGGGGGSAESANRTAGSGGSGGGAGGYSGSPGSGTSGQGNNGAAVGGAGTGSPGGGGGAGSGGSAQNGGAGASYAAFSSATSTGVGGFYAGGGGGSGDQRSTTAGGSGGSGGGGAGAPASSGGTAGNGSPASGGGGGGAAGSNYAGARASGSGGGGVVIIQYAV